MSRSRDTTLCFISQPISCLIHSNPVDQPVRLVKCSRVSRDEVIASRSLAHALLIHFPKCLRDIRTAKIGIENLDGESRQLYPLISMWQARITHNRHRMKVLRNVTPATIPRHINYGLTPSLRLGSSAVDISRNGASRPVPDLYRSLVDEGRVDATSGCVKVVAVRGRRSGCDTTPSRSTAISIFSRKRSSVAYPLRVIFVYNPHSER